MTEYELLTPTTTYSKVLISTYLKIWIRPARGERMSFAVAQQGNGAYIKPTYPHAVNG